MTNPPTDPRLVGLAFVPEVPLVRGEICAAIEDDDWERVFHLANDLLKEGVKGAGALRNFAWGVLCGRASL